MTMRADGLAAAGPAGAAAAGGLSGAIVELDREATDRPRAGRSDCIER